MVRCASGMVCRFKQILLLGLGSRGGLRELAHDADIHLGRQLERGYQLFVAEAIGPEAGPLQQAASSSSPDTVF
jgi:hypothetical protein